MPLGFGIRQPIAIQSVDVVKRPCPNFIVSEGSVNIRVVAEGIPLNVGSLAVLEGKGVRINPAVFVDEVNGYGVKSLAWADNVTLANS